MAATGVQGRAVMIDLRHHFGDERAAVTLDMLERVMKDDDVKVEEGDIELAAWLRQKRRSAFLLTAPPLRMPGAAGSPVTPVATV